MRRGRERTGGSAEPRFDYLVISPPGLADPTLPIAASRAGAIGILDLQFVSEQEKIGNAVCTLARHAKGRFGVRLDSAVWEIYEPLFSNLPDGLSFAIVTPANLQRLGEQIRILHRLKVAVLVEAISEEEARAGEEAGADALIAKGNESGGRCGEETTFVLLQRLLGMASVPVWAQGGIGLHSAAACAAAGAAGVVLDTQLALTRESALTADIRDAISRFDGSETVCAGHGPGPRVRVLPPLRNGAADVEKLLSLNPNSGAGDDPETWWSHVRERIGWDAGKGQLWPVGQEAAFAAPLARRFDRVARVLDAFRQATRDHLRAARDLKSLAQDSPLARAHKTRYPIVQGPMTRVSDRAEFALRVAEGGALPFLALALMRAPEAERLLTQTQAALGDRPWGVGILGFVPEDLRAEQLQVVRAAKPPFALIAGGRPGQALTLEAAGIPTYLHVPSAGLLKLFLEAGARKFVFEGRECGGHVGPRSSFVLWDSVVETLLNELPGDDLSSCHVLFAGGIHDARSASMAAALAAPLAERGAKIGVLLGTAYLFTHEAVTAGAIVDGFQQEALRCRETALLSSGPGHSTRCAVTPYVNLFEKERRRLLEEGQAPGEVQAALESLNIGRLRIAAKGITRSEERHDDGYSRLIPVEEPEQRQRGMYMIGQIAGLRTDTCSIEELHRDVSSACERLEESADRLSEGRRAEREERPFDIAIVGMSCLLPKASDLQTYWHNILNKIDAVTEVPADRWDWTKYYDPDPEAADKVSSKWGGFLDPICFDPAAYGMPPNSLRSIEPLQLLALASVRAALADAGYGDGQLSNERTSVILGVSGGIADLGQQYAVRAALPAIFGAVPAGMLEQLPAWSEDSFPGILPNVAAGRVANRYNFGGLNFTVDAACASSLAAVYVACRELEAGASDMVIVGGADTIQNPFAYLCFGKTHALSPRGRCATFDQTADGIAISEGVAMLVLKRLHSAERDGDHIYAVIKGVAGASDGRDKGLTAPRPEGQAQALHRAYAKAGFSPATVGLVEAHGTGTVAGDRAELETINRVFGGAGAPPRSVAIGSVKSMIGHTKSTAGVAGLVKVALSLRDKVLPPTIHVTDPNPAVGVDGSPYINTEARPWVQVNETPRRAGVSAFGFGGTNFHAVLEEYTGGYLEGDRQSVSATFPSELLLWRGESREDLRTKLAVMARAFAGSLRPRLCDVAYTLWQDARSPSALTLGMVVSSLDELREKIAWAAGVLDEPVSASAFASKKIFFDATPLASAGRTAFLFPGQGSQYPGMLGGLALYFDAVRQPFESASRALWDRFPQPLASYVFPPPRFRDQDRRADVTALMATNVTQPALGAAGVAMYRLLRRFGVEPDMVAGHSYGEYVALWAAGAFDENTLYTLSEVRGRCMAEGCSGEPGAMASVATDRATATAVMNGVTGVWIANINAPAQTVISGRREAVESAVRRLEQAGISSRALAVACAFHSPLMTEAREKLADAIREMRIGTPGLPVFSNVSAAAYPNDPAAVQQLLIEQLVNPVRFADEIQAMYDAGARVFVEVGPGRVLSGLVGQILGGAPHLAIATDVRDQPGLAQLQQALAQLAAHGVSVNLDPLFARRSLKRIDWNAPGTGEGDAPSPTSWMVSGGKAVPLRSAGSVSTGPTTPMRKASETSPQPAGTPAVRAQTPPTAIPPAGPRMTGSEDAEAVVLRFQQLMATFLDTQKEVMLAYLGGNSPEKLPDQIALLTPQATAPLQVNVGAAPEQTPTPESAAEVDVMAELLAIVAERTGYPTELLGPDLDLEADLGIDSIKHVEIVGEFGRRVLRARNVELNDVMTKLSSAKTLRRIIETAQGMISAASASRVVTPCSTDQVPRFLLEIVETVRPDRMHPLRADDRIIITDDGRGIAQEIAASLRARGAQVDVVAADSINAVRPRGISGILHLSPLRRRINAQAGVEGDLNALFELTRAHAGEVREAGQRGRGWIVAVSAMGGAFGRRSGADEWPFGHGAIAGFMKTLALEWPQVRCKVVDVDADGTPDLAKRLVDEIECGEDLTEVGFSGERRVTVRAVRSALDEAAAESVIASDTVVLITGGARGITAAIATHLARRYRPTLVIAGRIEVPPEETPSGAGIQSGRDLERVLTRQREARRNLDEMRRAGAKVSYHQVDVRDSGALGALVEETYRRHGRLDGLIHGAGIIEDSLLERKTPESFARVYDTKVRGALALVSAVLPETLRFFALFSSVAGCFGNRGQIDYTSANDTLNKLALYLDRRWPGRVVSLNWGPWAGVGMAAGAVQQQLVDQGMKPIEVEVGCAAFDRELRCGRKGQVEVVLGQGRWDDTLRRHAGAGSEGD